MPVVLTLRIPKGAPLTAVEHDQNLTNLKNATDANTLSVTGRLTIADFDLAFEGEDADGKKQVDWANVLNVPGGSLLPTGALLDYAGNTPPTGFLLCDGSAVSRVTYADLFTLLGSLYGAGDGTNTFNVPDFRGRTSVGRGTGDATGATAWSIGQKKGEETHVLTIAELAKHSHKFLGSIAGGSGDAYAMNTANGRSAGGRGDSPANYLEANVSGKKFIEETGTDTPHNNVQPSLTVTKIIKT